MNFGAAELITLAVLGLLIFGPRKLPEIARMASKAMRELRSVTQEFRHELEAGLKAEESTKSKIPPIPEKQDRDDFPLPGPLL